MRAAAVAVILFSQVASAQTSIWIEAPPLHVLGPQSPVLELSAGFQRPLADGWAWTLIASVGGGHVMDWNHTDHILVGAGPGVRYFPGRDVDRGFFVGGRLRLVLGTAAMLGAQGEVGYELLLGRFKLGFGVAAGGIAGMVGDMNGTDASFGGGMDINLSILRVGWKF